MADVDIPYRVISAMKFMSKVNPGENCRRRECVAFKRRRSGFQAFKSQCSLFRRDLIGISAESWLRLICVLDGGAGGRSNNWPNAENDRQTTGGIMGFHCRDNLGVEYLDLYRQHFDLFGISGSAVRA